MTPPPLDLSSFVVSKTPEQHHALCTHSLLVCKVNFVLLGPARFAVHETCIAVGVPFLAVTIQPLRLLPLDILAGSTDALLPLDIGDRLVEDLCELGQDAYAVPLSLCGPDVVHELTVDLLHLFDGAA